MEERKEREASEALKGRDRSNGLRREERKTVPAHIAIKGTRSGLLLTLEPEMPFSDLLNALAERLAEAPAFFRGASLTVDTSRRALRVSERIQLERLLAHYQMSVAAIDRVDVQREAKTVQLPPEHFAPMSPPPAPPPTPRVTVTRELQPAGMPASVTKDPRTSADTLFIRRTVRSGQAIKHASNIVILGDVNPGAEIVAGGDIIVWGMLRGMVHAGYPNNESAVVCSLYLSPVQLRIAHLLSRPPEGFEAQTSPEVAMIREGQIVVETWVSGRPPRK